MSVFGVILVRIFLAFSRIRTSISPYSVRMQENAGKCGKNAEQKNFEYGHFLRSVRDYFSKAETEKCDQEDWSIFDKFGIISPCSAIYILEAGAPVSLKLEECDQSKYVFFFHNFATFIPCSKTYFLKIFCTLLYIIFWWLLVDQNEKLIKEIELEGFQIKILFCNYKRLSIQLGSSRPELLCKKRCS